MFLRASRSKTPRRYTSQGYVEIKISFEQFTYDDLGNRITLNNRAGSDIVYSYSVNEYTGIGGATTRYSMASGY